MTNVVITMAGLGKRFRDAGYDCPKYEINVHGRTLFEWSMLSLRSFIQAGARFIFVVRREDHAEAFIRQECKVVGITSVKIVEIAELTDGQATSAILGGDVLDSPEEPFLVYNIDTFVHPDALPADEVRGDGWVPCFPGKGDGWSFAAAEVDGSITDMREKMRISPHATIGLYWFSSYLLYKQVYAEYYSDPARMEKGEKYIAPMYRQMIQDGCQVYLQEVGFDAVIPLGTPAEVEAFELRAPPIVNLPKHPDGL
ncbi:glycosyltransferase family 2 protein [Glaciimonas sp. CA11.2]|uniref:glycosyltransferase family 2 protein n=1 Tax=Glaciimonas sp. CA11.2 TaxID=3048601 RepID=UPI002AB50301|nr:glycosyltransferase family 2 protein [Glaciimonas sp. CA11.2]MDY7545043.1 glycosyltransferase family 2 protein [Glaciimonas sp. CA11.2]MEB0163697.1 glycosyltransferase family 2 protein [Glaciimonas sp. CA11.2]